MGYAVLQLAGVTTVARRLRSGGLILCYHNVIPETEAGLWGGLGLHMPFPMFARQMRWLKAKYDVISLDKVVERVTHGISLRGTVALTFDDAYVGIFEDAWPLLRDLGLPATVFVVAQAPGRDTDFWWDHPAVVRAYSPARREHWVTALRGDGAAIVASLGPNGGAPLRAPRSCRPAEWQTIADAAGSGLDIGVHSATHRSLPALDESDLRREVIESPMRSRAARASSRSSSPIPTVFGTTGSSRWCARRGTAQPSLSIGAQSPEPTHGRSRE